MKMFSELQNPAIATMLKDGKIGVIRTDTLYGIVCLADLEASVERVFACKGRDEGKPPIVLISSEKNLYDVPSKREQKVLAEEWPGKVSVILRSQTAPPWIVRGGHSVAYRLPDSNELCRLIDRTGPLIAPSANQQGKEPARTIQEAIGYFSEKIDFYVDGGMVTGAEPSRLIRIDDDGNIDRIR